MPWIGQDSYGRPSVHASKYAVRISFPLDCLISVYYAGRYLGFAQGYRYVVDRVIPFFIHHSYFVSGYFFFLAELFGPVSVQLGSW